jgi:hypothetical protein
MSLRAAARQASNNPDNPNQNICALRAVEYFGAEQSQRYLHNAADVFRAIGSRFSVRSVKSKMAKTVGGSRAAMATVAAADSSIVAFVVVIAGHVLVCNRDGKTVVDTAPRKNDRRKVRFVKAVRHK